MIALFSGKLSLQSDIMAWRIIKINIYFGKKIFYEKGRNVGEMNISTHNVLYLRCKGFNIVGLTILDPSIININSCLNTNECIFPSLTANRVFNMAVRFDTRKNYWYSLFNDRFQFHE